MRDIKSTDGDYMDDVFLQEDLRPTIGEHATQCHSLFHKYMARPNIVPDPTVMDDQLARFTLWTSNMDVYGPLNVSLDYRLRFSPTAADIIHQLLDIICDTLQSCGSIPYCVWIGRAPTLIRIVETVKPFDDREPQTPSRKRQRISEYYTLRASRDPDDDASDSESDIDPAEKNIMKITETIGGTLTRLFRLSNAVRKSAKANRARKIKNYTDDEEANKAIDELRLFTECYIKFRFPNAPEALCSALVSANVLRLRRLYYQRTHQRRIDLSVQGPLMPPTVVQLPQVTQSAPAVRFATETLQKPATPKVTPSFSPAPATNATTARQTAVAAFYAKSTTEVHQARSVLVNSKLSFPPLPPTKQCPYCGVIVEFKSATRLLLWHNHVVEDLEPFACVLSSCLERHVHDHEAETLTFETSKAWSTHMQTAHGQSWECRAPSHAPLSYHEEIKYQDHMVKEHGVPEAHVGALSNAARRPFLDKVVECPFGDDFQVPQKVSMSAVFASEALQSHVAAHMKEIALLTLQKLPSDDDENAENVDSDQALEDEGPGGNRRASMYSILDDESLDFQDENAEAAEGSKRQHEEDLSARVEILDLKDQDELTMTDLHRAVHIGDVQSVKSLIESGANTQSRDGYGQTPLHYAVERGLIECMDALLNADADLHCIDDSGFSPFIWAVIAGQKDVAARLLSIWAVDPNSTSPDGRTALAWAAKFGWSPITRLLLDYGANINYTQHGKQTLPLQEAAASGDHLTVSWLLEAGGDPNHRDRDGWAAIHFAAEQGHLGIVNSLLRAGANANAVSSYGTSPLHCAANGGHPSIIELLLEWQSDPLKSTCHGWTALHHSAFMGDSHVVEYLLLNESVRFVASQQDNHGWSALHLAVHRRNAATVSVLLNVSAIADPQILFDDDGLTAEDWLDRGLTSQPQKAVSSLAFSKSRCCRVVTGLRQAVTIGSVPMIRRLLRSRSDINGTDSGRRTALYHAAKYNMLPIVELLLDHGADPCILPIGRERWEDFVPPGDVLLRLRQAGYRNLDADPEREHMIRQMFKDRKQRSMHQQEPAWSESYDLASEPVVEQMVSRDATKPTSSISASLTPPILNPSFTPDKRARSPVPENETKDNKRKLNVGRSDWWKRFTGGR